MLQSVCKWGVVGVFVFVACSDKTYKKNTFGYDVTYLKKHTGVEILKTGQSQIAVVGAYQGRVMTSTAKGMQGRSYGFLKYDVIASPIDSDKPIHIFGGEDRFWLGPEGSQFSIFFKQGKEMNFNHWKTPKAIDTEPYTILNKSNTSLTYGKNFSLVNYSGYTFEIEVTRKISILNKQQIQSNLSLESLQGIDFVGFQSENSVKNTGTQKWQKDKGLLSIWILGMFIPSEKTTVIIPYRGDLDLNTAYFGAIGADRLSHTDKAVFFKGDGKYRSKIGVLPKNALPILGSYDAQNNILTIVKCSFDTNNTAYVNSLWQPYVENPYGGDVVNSYNDGPLEDGNTLGPFYELETSSSVKELEADESLQHTHQTYHFEGSYEALNNIAKKLLHVDLNEISNKL